jgi:hypothetical protein
MLSSLKELEHYRIRATDTDLSRAQIAACRNIGMHKPVSRRSM